MVRVLVRLRCRVAQIEDKSMETLVVWLYLQRHFSELLENAAPLATTKMELVYINYKIDNVKVNNR